MNDAAVMQYQEDEIILHQGERNRAIYKILSGNVALYMNYGTEDEYLVGLLGFPSCFGEMTILADQPSYYTVVALEETTVLRVPESNFEAFIQSDHRHAMSIMKTMAKNLSLLNVNMNMMIEELKALSSGGGADEQTIRRLVESVTVTAPLEDTAFTEPVAQEEEPEEPMECGNPELPGHKLFPRITHKAYKDYTYEKDYTCPHCHHHFLGERICHSKLIPVQSQMQQMRYDLHISYKDFEPEWYDVVTCPRCCFSALDRHFIEPTEVEPDRFVAELLRSRFAAQIDFAGERDLNSVFARHYLALICAPGLPEARQITARLWNNLYWLYRSAGEDELARRAQGKAIDAYQTVCRRCKLDPLHKQQLCMKVAGMLYLADRLEEARAWAVDAHECRVERVGHSRYVDLSQLLIQEIREKLENKGEHHDTL
ncbi:MAG: DUF2225 domain-containing protein [Oscillospiraceae bacterium]|nr:DUF2225 domain-containing protein [Oscillospiraceae bacterium]